MSKELYRHLKDAGLLEFGSHIPAVQVQLALGLEVPQFGTKKQFDELAMREMAAIDYVRNILLNEGKYLAGNQGDYRILLPSETMLQVDRYMAQADRKLRRAMRLKKHMPATNGWADNSDARMVLKRDSIRYHLEPGIGKATTNQPPSHRGF